MQSKKVTVIGCNHLPGATLGGVPSGAAFAIRVLLTCCCVTLSGRGFACTVGI